LLRVPPLRRGHHGSMARRGTVHGGLMPRLSLAHCDVMSNARITQFQFVPNARIPRVAIMPAQILAHLPWRRATVMALHEPRRARNTVVGMALVRHGAAGKKGTGQQDRKNLSHEVLLACHA
jgi:hypothetical protein